MRRIVSANRKVGGYYVRKICNVRCRPRNPRRFRMRIVSWPRPRTGRRAIIAGCGAGFHVTLVIEADQVDPSGAQGRRQGGSDRVRGYRGRARVLESGGRPAALKTLADEVLPVVARR